MPLGEHHVHAYRVDYSAGSSGLGGAPAAASLHRSAGTRLAALVGRQLMPAVSNPVGMITYGEAEPANSLSIRKRQSGCT